MIERNGVSESEQKLLTLASWGNGIKTDLVAVITLFSYVLLGATQVLEFSRAES